MSKDLSIYEIGFTPFFAAQADARFSYCLYVPKSYSASSDQRYNLIVLVHGTERSPSSYRHAFSSMAEDTDSIILAPLFPCNTFSDDDFDNYKMILCNGVRYDEILLSMVAEVTTKYRLKNDKFLMFGFSGGGHFTHRFFYLHPQRLQAISIGAPGMVTLLDNGYDFWVGTKNWSSVFGQEINYEALKQVKIQMLVGELDTELWEIGLTPEDELWMPGAELTGPFNRNVKMQALKQNYQSHGLEVEHAIVAGAGHITGHVIDAAVQYFYQQLSGSDKAYCGRQSDWW